MCSEKFTTETNAQDQPQCPGLWHSSSPSARSLSRPPSSLPPSFTQSPSPPRSLVRDGQTSPHRPRLVVSRSTCSPLSPSLDANSFVLGTAVINIHTHAHVHRDMTLHLRAAMGPLCPACEARALVCLLRCEVDPQHQLWLPQVLLSFLCSCVL
jgi:hypothetical protein